MWDYVNMLIYTYHVIVVAFFTCLFSLICAISLALLDKRAKRILRLEAGTTGMPTLTLTTHYFFIPRVILLCYHLELQPRSPRIASPKPKKPQPKTPKPQPQQMRNNKDKKESKSREKNFIICALSIIQSSSCALNQFT